MCTHSKHPYYDPKTKESDPTWFMVDVAYRSHVKHPVTLSLLKSIATAQNLPSCVEYIGQDGFKGIRDMALVNRGRLSEFQAMIRNQPVVHVVLSPVTGVQPVETAAYDAILLLAERGGFEELEPKKTRKATRTSAAPASQSKRKSDTSEMLQDQGESASTLSRRQKRAKSDGDAQVEPDAGLRRSTRKR